MRWWRVAPMIAAIVAAFALTPAALAGGWSVVSLDRLPQNQAPGVETEIAFTVRQHGVHPIDGVTPIVVLTNRATGEQVTAYGQPDGSPGHYRASFALNQPGRWEWSIDVFEGDHAMPPLDVGIHQGASTASTPRDTPAPVLWVPLVIVAVLAGASSFVLAASGRLHAQTANASH